MIRLETPRLLIRDHVWEDLDSHHALFSDPVVMRCLPDLMTRSMEASRANLQRAIDEITTEPRTCYFLRIEHLQSGEHIGEIGYTVEQRTPAGKLASMGYFIWARFWGMGYTSEALRELIRFAFEEDSVVRVSAGCLTENRGSERVMQKCGMIKEAERIKCQWHEGLLKDRVEYRLLYSEYNTQLS